MSDIQSGGDAVIRSEGNLEVRNITAKSISTISIAPGVSQETIDLAMQIANGGTPFPRTQAAPSQASLSNNCVRVRETPSQENRSVIGKVIRCSCGLSSVTMNDGRKLCGSSSSSQGVTFNDEAGKSHTVSAKGVYNILDNGNGEYRLQYIGEHCSPNFLKK